MPTSEKTNKTRKPRGKQLNMRGQSKFEAEFELQLKAVKEHDYTRELQFHRPRRFRFDFAWLGLMFAVEIEGITYNFGRHQRVEGYERDLEKYTIAMLDGWIVYRCSGSAVSDGTAITNTLQMLRNLRDGNNSDGIRGNRTLDDKSGELSGQRIGKSNSAKGAVRGAKKRGKSDSRNGRKGKGKAQTSKLKPAIEATPAVTKLIIAAKAARIIKDDAQKDYDAIIDKLKNHIGDAIGVDQMVEWLARERMVIDAKKLKADHPDVYAQVVNKLTDRRFKILDEND